MQLFLGAVPIILRLFSKARGHLLFSNYSWNNLPEPTCELNQQMPVLSQFYTCMLVDMLLHCVREYSFFVFFGVSD
jgi:hypothetical protein